MDESKQKSSFRWNWTYFLPSLHLAACAASMVGFLIPKLQFWGIGFTFIMLVDFPISLVAYAIGWNHPAFAVSWIVIVGTLWWYFLSRVGQRILRTFGQNEIQETKG